MTQKELLYFEDAIGHEDNIIKICNEVINLLQDQNLVSFMQSEVNTHMLLKEKLINILEGKANG